MTDLPDSTEELLASVEAKQKASHRVFRRVTITSMGTLLLIAALDTLFVVLGGGAWFWRDLVAIGGLTVLGMLGYLGAARAYQVVVQRDAELLEHMRNEARLAVAVDDMRPLMAAIEDARQKGVPLLIPPGSVGGSYSFGATPDKPTVH